MTFKSFNYGVLSSILLFSCVPGADAKEKSDSHAGVASVYSYTGHRTANGERLNIHGLTAAHKSLPFGTRVRVTNNRNGHSVVVRINDRGPFVRGRVIDMTPAGARALGFSGLAPVRLAVLGRS
jgi:rare lipoprotein A